MAVSLKVDCRITADETNSQDLGIGRMLHTWLAGSSNPTTYASGTGSNQQDLVYSQTLSLAGSAQTLDLTGSLTSELTGGAVNFVEITLLAVRNKSTTSTENVTVGAGSNPWITWLNATGDAVVVGPGGILVWSSPVDGAAVTAGTGDILTLDPGADTFDVDVLICGRSA